MKGKEISKEKGGKGASPALVFHPVGTLVRLLHWTLPNRGALTQHGTSLVLTFPHTSSPLRQDFLDILPLRTTPLHLQYNPRCRRSWESCQCLNRTGLPRSPVLPAPSASRCSVFTAVTRMQPHLCFPPTTWLKFRAESMSLCSTEFHSDRTSQGSNPKYSARELHLPERMHATGALISLAHSSGPVDFSE